MKEKRKNIDKKELLKRLACNLCILMAWQALECLQGKLIKAARKGRDKNG